MADQDASTTDAEEQTDEQDRLDPADEQIVAQADQPDAVRSALRSIRGEQRAAVQQAQELAARVREFEDRDRTDTERLTSRAEEAEQAAQAARERVTELEAGAMRSRIGAEVGLPAALVDRLRGDDEDQVRSDAEELLAAMQPAPPRGGFGGGPRGSTKTDMNSFIRSGTRR